MQEEIIAEFEEFCASVECAISPADPVVADDKIHRFTISGENKKNGVYQLKISDGLGIGWVRSHRVGVTYKWHSRVKRKLSAEEKAVFKERIAAEQAAKEAEQAGTENVAADRARYMWERAARTGDSAYITRKQIKADGCRFYSGMMLIPIYVEGALTSLQFITPTGEKRFLKQGKIKGGYAPLATAGDDKSVVVICEGYADGCSLRMATGFPVVVGFTASNLEAVGKVIRKKYPDARIIFAADNDCHLERNIGIISAQQAAIKINGHVIWPESLNGEKIDFSDMHVKQGLDAVRERILIAAAQSPALESDREAVDYDLSESRSDSLPPPPDEDFFPYNILGHNEGLYYFLSKNSGQIVALAASQLGSIMNLYRLAPDEFWRKYYGNEKTKSREVAERASNHLIDASHRRGVFRPQNTRGIGVWIDEGRSVLHGGDYLYVDGQRYKPHDFKSQYIYPMRETTLRTSDDVIASKDAVKLREICAMLSWENKLSGELLAGWCVIAPICAALPWRPHIWITGESQSGKTTVLQKIIMPIIGNIALHVDGGTTEPSLRQEMGFDGRPIIYDEAEAENQRDVTTMEAVLGLARRSSSGGTIIKGSTGGKATRYTARSSFCFAGINPAIRHRADESRISMLVLKRMGARDGESRYTEIKKKIREVITEDFAARLFARTFRHLDILLKNVVTFSDAAAEVLCDRRAADQIGAMLAGLYSLNSTKAIDYQAAVDWIRKHDWQMHTAVMEQSDPEKLIMTVATKTIRYLKNKNMIEDTIGELIQASLGSTGQEKDHDAEKILRAYGIWPREDGVWIANKSPKLEKLLEGTPWHSWNRTLSDIAGAQKKNATQFSFGLTSRAVVIPYVIFGIQFGLFGEEINF